MNSTTSDAPLLWLRSETKANECRSPLTPEGAKTLIGKGFQISVEAQSERVFPDHEFKSAGCTIESAGSWIRAPRTAWILGLKALPSSAPTQLIHRHIYFGHAYKGQADANDLLTRFQIGKGTLFDLEYLTQKDGRRVAAFGYWAGYAGCAIALASWACQSQGKLLGAIKAFPERQLLDQFVEEKLNVIRPSRSAESSPRCIVIGAKGRSGQGAIQCLSNQEINATFWDLAETAGGGPFEEIYRHDILINCVLLTKATDPFITRNDLVTAPKLKTICDVSCDPYHPFNPLPIYSNNTSFSTPSSPIHETDAQIISIDNLPTLLPRESSEDFASQLLPHLIELPERSLPWQNAKTTYETMIHSLPC